MGLCPMAPDFAAPPAECPRPDCAFGVVAGLRIEDPTFPRLVSLGENLGPK